MASSQSLHNRRGTIFARYVDPIRNARSMEGQVLLAETIAKLVAVIITSIGFFIWGMSVAAQYVDQVWVHWLTGALFAGIAAWITDFAFSHFLENSLFQFLAFWRFNWFWRFASEGFYITLLLRPLRWAVVTIIVAALFWADWNSVYTLRSPIANAKKEKVERIDFAQLDAAQRQRIHDQVGPIDAEIAQVRDDIRKTEKDITAANTGLRELAQKGNKWAPGELQRKKDRATKQARKRLQSLQEQRDRAYAAITGASQQERGQAIADDAAAVATEAENKAAISTLFTQFGIGSKILTILFRLFLIINFLINTPNWDANRDGVIDGEDVTAAAQGVEQSEQRITEQPAPRGPSPAYAERRPIGFHRQEQEPPDTPKGRTHQIFTNIPLSPIITVPAQNAVEQCSTANSPQTVVVPEQSERAGLGVLADVREWEKRANQTYKRSFTSQREEYRDDNRQRSICYSIMLKCVGVQVTEDPDAGELKFQHPAEYTLSDDVLFVIAEQKKRLEQIGKRRVEV